MIIEYKPTGGCADCWEIPKKNQTNKKTKQKTKTKIQNKNKNKNKQKINSPSNFDINVGITLVCNKISYEDL